MGRHTKEGNLLPARDSRQLTHKQLAEFVRETRTPKRSPADVTRRRRPLLFGAPNLQLQSAGEDGPLGPTFSHGDAADGDKSIGRPRQRLQPAVISRGRYT
jgi:hypothetical protein